MIHVLQEDSERRLKLVAAGTIKGRRFEVTETKWKIAIPGMKGHFCGYIESPLAEKEHYEFEWLPSVHGGWTYGGAFPLEGKTKCFGFDTAHFGDEEADWTAKKVKAELERVLPALLLVEQNYDAWKALLARQEEQREHFKKRMLLE